MNIFTKSSLIGLTLLTATFMSSCDKTETADDTKAVGTQAAEPVAAAPTEPKVSTVASLTTDSIDNLLFNPMIASGALTDEQVTCLESRDKSLTTQKAQEFYEQNFSKEELDELNNFYESPTGQKLVDYGNEQMLVMSGMPLETPMASPSEAEIAEMKKFMESPLGQKYQYVNNSEGEDSLLAVLNPIVLSEFERCKIEGMT